MKESALNSHGTQCIQCSVMLWREGHFKLGERERDSESIKRDRTRVSGTGQEVKGGVV